MVRARSKLAQRLAGRGRRAPPPPVVEDERETLPLAALLDAFAEPLLLLRDMRIVRANAAARALLGVYIEQEDVRLAIRHPEASALIAAGEDGVAALGGLGDTQRRFDMHARRLDADHRLLRLEDRSAALATEKMRTDFVANASHELRTPLATISGFVETLEEANGPRDSAVRARFLGIMAQEARRMQRLIDDLMSLSRIEADRFVRPSERLELSAAVRAACAEIEGGGTADGRLELALEGACVVLGDAGQISQLLHNVVGNALKYGAERGPVEVRLACTDQEAQLVVRDRGEGVPAEYLPRLTERFFRVDAGRSRSLGGTGLGLAIVKHIVERHRGRLEISSEPGAGTTVTVSLPLADAMSQ